MPAFVEEVDRNDLSRSLVVGGLGEIENGP
ncbi:uncharacterized protein METZ01_LOCUS270341, partial [marine metagenome]